MSEIKKSIKSDAFWVRTLFIVLFSIVYRVLDVVVLLLVLVQWGYTLLTGQVNPALNEFSESLSCYIAQIVRFVTSSSEIKPFPFTDWPTPKRDMPTEK